MSALFFDDRGIASARVGAGIPVTLQVGGWNEGRRFKAALSGYAMGGQTGFQALHTLRDVIYIYVFGERMGALQLSGFAFVGLCDADEDTTGVDDVYDYYNNNRLSNTGMPVQITIGFTTSIQAFLVGFNLQIVDPSMSLAQFTLSLVYPPKRAVVPIAGGAGGLGAAIGAALTGA